MPHTRMSEFQAS